MLLSSTSSLAVTENLMNCPMTSCSDDSHWHFLLPDGCKILTPAVLSYEMCDNLLVSLNVVQLLCLCAARTVHEEITDGDHKKEMSPSSEQGSDCSKWLSDSNLLAEATRSMIPLIWNCVWTKWNVYCIDSVDKIKIKVFALPVDVVEEWHVLQPATFQGPSILKVILISSVSSTSLVFLPLSPFQGGAASNFTNLSRNVNGLIGRLNPHLSQAEKLEC